MRTPRSDTGERWRTLGFYHEPDTHQRVWRFVGAISGLQTLARMLTSQADKAERTSSAAALSIGPYDDFTIRVWERAGIDDESIYGTPADLRRLSRLLEARLSSARAGSDFVLGTDYAPDVEYTLVFEVKDEGFDPADIAPGPADDGGSLEGLEGGETPAAMRSPALSFAFNDPNASFTESEGMIWLEDDDIVIEYQTKDAFFGTFKSAVKVARVPLDAISWVKFKRGLFGAELSIQARAMTAVEHIPASTQGRLRLKFTRDLRDEAARLSEAVRARITYEG
jgi:hypothetical protein